jgi:hypothetical protein
MKKILILSLFFISISCSNEISQGKYKDYETAEFEVIKKEKNIEIRNYQEYIVAEVEVEGTRKEAAKKGFWILAKYIFGKNSVEEKIAMTSPVFQSKKSDKFINQQDLENLDLIDEIDNKSEVKSEKIAMTSPVSQIQKDDKKWLIQFKMPKKYSLNNLPKPINNKINFKKIAAKKVVSITFSGLWSDEKFQKNKEKLIEFAAQNQLKLINQEVISYYDDPFTLPWNRRNEIIWQIGN